LETCIRLSALLYRNFRKTQVHYSCNSEKQSWNNDNLKSIRNDELNKFENNLLEYLHKNEYLQINFLDKKNPSISLLDLSSGEKVYLEFLTNISYNLKKLNSDKIFLLDEPDLTLHPKWQKKLVSNILKCNDKIKNKKIHFILTTHSPFVLSDIPKENVIFLEKYKKNEDKNQEEGNCKNATKYIELKTFGANIHTLLSDGFFMSDGLMGEFAKSKISEILDFFNDKEKLKTIEEKQIKPIIESIGEDFLRNKLLDLYYKKFTKDKKEKEKLILKNRIDELQKQYDELNK
jgi:predicted ATP-binding protein involved in virulence